jgi:uncharacterized protein (DUF885 family)
MSDVRELADRFHVGWLTEHPFAASSYGIPGYEHLVPDDSEEGDAAWRSRLETTLAEARALEDGPLSEDDAITIACIVEEVSQELAMLDSAPLEHTVTAMPFSGPAGLLAVAARTVMLDVKAADDYLERLRRAGGWIDRQTERLRIGASKGRLPVGPLVEQAISWGDAVLTEAVPVAVVTPEPPADLENGRAWREERDSIAAEVVKPALARWVGQLRELLPVARPPESAGLVFLPGGETDYARAVRMHTTLPISADELHQIGLDEIARLEARALELGSEIGLGDLAAVHEATRASSSAIAPARAIEAAVEAIRRAEAVAGEFFPEPLPPPCAVTPMPSVVGTSGMAPHYSPPRLDGGRPGTFWFNVDRPTAGTGWDIEGVAFHEAVPGHHLQLSRIQQLGALPDLQRQRSLTVFSEGWGLYAEQLAEEMGLYSGTESLLGALSNSLMRAARLVVDTGMHAYGWSRAQALQFFTAHVPMPEGFLGSEIDRYIILPGQALAYLTGKREIVRLRAESERRLAERFSLREFHAAVLDSGSLPIPVLQRKISGWQPG